MSEDHLLCPHCNKGIRVKTSEPTVEIYKLLVYEEDLLKEKLEVTGKC
jgi:hypothetical protein